MNVNEMASLVLSILLPPLVALGIEYLRRRIGLENLQRIKQEFEAKQEYALVAVRFAEQVFKEKGGAVKYQAACEQLSNFAVSHGWNMTPLEIEGLIESSVQILKTELAEIWVSEEIPPTPSQ